jgi:hypothetical protein
MHPEAFVSPSEQLPVRGVFAPIGDRMGRARMARVEMALFMSMGGYFALSLLSLASLA